LLTPGDFLPCRRLFFALWPDEAARASLARIMQSAKRDAGGRAPAPERFHMTLAYPGVTLEERVDALVALGTRAAGRSFRLELNEIGTFRQGVVWAGPAVIPEPLALLAASLDMELKRNGFPNRQRRFTPHITLLREAKALVELRLTEPIAFDVIAFSLVASHLPPERVWYEVIQRFPLH
jgi:2'-5' RNA ligase